MKVIPVVTVVKPTIRPVIKPVKLEARAYISSMLAEAQRGGGTILTPDNHELSTGPIEIVDLEPGIYQEPLITCVFGDPGSGKSTLCGSAPGPICLVPTEHKSKQFVLKAAARFGRRVRTPNIDLIRAGRSDMSERMPVACVMPENMKRPGITMKDEDAIKMAERVMDRKAKEMPLDGPEIKCCQRHYYRYHVNRIKSVLFAFAAMPKEECATIVIDTFGQFVEDMLYANYGRIDHIMPLDKKTFNQEVANVLNAICCKHVILTHHTTQIWKDNKPTNKVKPKNSFSKIGHYISVMIELERDDDRKIDSQGNWPPKYSMKVRDCAANPELIGETLLGDEEINFKELAMKVYPESREEEWD